MAAKRRSAQTCSRQFFIRPSFQDFVEIGSRNSRLSVMYRYSLFSETDSTLVFGLMMVSA